MPRARAIQRRGRARISAELVRSIERRLAVSKMPTEVALEMGVSEATVKRIKRGAHPHQERATPKLRCCCGAILKKFPCLACRLRKINRRS